MFVAISWWSWAGKSTVCRSLIQKYPDRFSLIQLDWYFKNESLVPNYAGLKNRDHPDAIDVDRLYVDLLDLQSWKSVFVPVKDETLEAKDDELEPRLLTEVFSKEIILVEGFLCLYDERIRELYDMIIRLDTDPEIRWNRRVHFKNDVYKEKILDPMYECFVMPTKKYATHVIDVTNLSKDDVLMSLEKSILNI